MNHALLPSVARATLPVKYEAAKLALAECNRIDECKDWADKTAALASYAKQSGDKTMENTAMRIRARAIRRCGQLLQEFEKAHGKNKGNSMSNHTNSRKDAATQAGLSKNQAVTAIRVARVNGKDFEQQIESDNPPTISSLAEQGMKKGIPLYVQLGMTKQAFQAGMYFRGDVEHHAKATERFDPQDVIDGSDDFQRKEMKRNIKLIEKYHNKLMEKL